MNSIVISVENSATCPRVSKDKGSGSGQKYITIDGVKMVTDKPVHGRVVVEGRVSPYCATYCVLHVNLILNRGWDIVPEHLDDLCAGYECGHGEPTMVRV